MHSPLHYAAKLGHTDIARMLIEKGICSVNSAFGMTPESDTDSDDEVAWGQLQHKVINYYYYYISTNRNVILLQLLLLDT